MNQPMVRMAARPGRAVSTVVGSCVVVAAVAAPWLLDGYSISMASRMLALALLAISVHLLAATSGLASLGQAGLFAVGAYTAAQIARHLTPVGVVQVLAAVLATALVAAVTGLAVVRTRGIVFVMVTLAYGELTYAAAEQWRGLTGGNDGLATPPVVPVWGMPHLTNDGLTYLWVLAVFLVAYLATAVMLRSPLGLTVRGAGDSEMRIRALGYPVSRVLLVNYIMAGALAGAAGALWVTADNFVVSTDVNFTASAMALVAVVIGGLRATWGAIAGTIVVVLVRDVLAANLTGPLLGKGPLLLGVLLVVCVYLFPGGISGLFSRTGPVLPLVTARQRTTPASPEVPGGRGGGRIPAQDRGAGSRPGAGGGNMAGGPDGARDRTGAATGGPDGARHEATGSGGG